MEIEDTLRDWLILTQAKGIGPIAALSLLAEYGEPHQILASGSGRLRQSGLTEETIAYLYEPDVNKLERSLQWLSEPDNYLITFLDKEYPALLKTLYDPLPVLFVSGYLAALNHVHFAIVGSRNPTADGRRHAENYAAALTKNGFENCPFFNRIACIPPFPSITLRT